MAPMADLITRISLHFGVCKLRGYTTVILSLTFGIILLKWLIALALTRTRANIEAPKTRWSRSRRRGVDLERGSCSLPTPARSLGSILSSPSGVWAKPQSCRVFLWRKEFCDTKMCLIINHRNFVDELLGRLVTAGWA